MIASTSKVKLNADKFLKGIGGILIWFFFAGIFIIEHPSSFLKSSFMQMIDGTSHFAVIGKQTGTKF